MLNKQFSTLQALMRMSTVKRWHLIEVRREQSLAEHSYRVWALAIDLYTTMFGVPHNSFEFLDLQMHALSHDIEEIVSGDINSLFKAQLEKLAPGVLDRARDDILRNIDLGVFASRSGNKGSVVVPIVEIADLIEAMLYFKKYGVDDPIIKVREFQDTKLSQLFKDAITQFPQHEWGKAGLWVESILA